MKVRRLSEYTLREKLVFIYAVGMGVPFLFACLVIMGIPSIYFFIDEFRELSMLFLTAVAVLLWDERIRAGKKMPGSVVVLGIAFSWMILRFLLDRHLFYENDPTYIWSRAYNAFFLFFPCGFLLKKEEMRKTICILAVIACCLTVPAAIGDYCVATNSLYYTPSGTTIGIQEYYGVYRLWMAHFPTVSSENLFLSICLSTAAMIATEKKWLRFCLILPMIIQIAAIGFADGRAVMIAMGILFGIAAFIWVRSHFRKKIALGTAAGIVAALLTVVVCYIVCSAIPNLVHVNWNEVSSKQRASAVMEIAPSQQPDMPQEDTIKLSSLAYIQVEEKPKVSLTAVNPEPEWVAAEDDQSDVPIHRGLEGTFSGRTAIWKSVVRALKDNPDMILWGKTPLGYWDLLVSYGFPDYQAHVHNMYLQVLVDWGIPGVILMLIMLVVFAVSALRLIFNERLTFWERFIPAPAIALLAVEMVECFMRLTGENLALYLVLLFMGMTIGMDQQNKEDRNAV